MEAGSHAPAEICVKFREGGASAFQRRLPTGHEGMLASDLRVFVTVGPTGGRRFRA